MSDISFTVADVNKAIDTLVKTQARASQSVAAVLTMSVYCSIKGIEGSHVAVANTLLKVLRKSTKRDAIVAFLEHYGQLAYVGQQFEHFTSNAAAKALAWTPEYVEVVKLAAGDWESFRKPTIEAELDIEAGVQRLIDKASKAQKSGKTVKNAKLLVELQSALAKFHAANAV